ncbi:CPBP family glutamic-type intramembrane protease [Microvirga sp. 2TAF3]|uniref:CPBP family glutamic-type intramembrane protease n=1 Tax=Microvirga sp. 2TAF3 TaxID=3233014 RepID=UPI003F9C086D
MTTFAKPFLAFGALGLLGVLSLIPSLAPAIAQLRRLPEAPALSETALMALLLLQPSALTLIAVAGGVALAERAGLTSLILKRLRGEVLPPAKGRWASTLSLAAIGGILAAAIDLILRKLFPASFTGLPRLDEVSTAGRLTALLYGGITEELLMRFGLMTLLLRLGMRLTGGRRPVVLVWTAITLAALAFAAGHLPALMGAVSADGVLILRTLGLNGALGLLYGWLYAHRSLEHAMLAHAATHVVFWVATPFLVTLGL